MQKLCSDLQQPQSEIPIVLLYGPPGTGKTHAVECLASTACQAFTLNARQLVAQRAETLFGQMLEKIMRMERALIFVDECEVVFPIRSVMSNYASVEVRSHQRMLASFLEWTNQTPGNRPPLIILATNCLDQLDPAITDRVHMIRVPLPGPAQCGKWWSGHSPAQWAYRDLKCMVLGWLSTAMGLSFRGMDDVFKKLRDMDAAPGQSMPDQRPGEPNFEIYLKRIFDHARSRSPTFAENLSQVNGFYLNSFRKISILSAGPREERPGIEKSTAFN